MRSVTFVLAAAAFALVPLAVRAEPQMAAVFFTEWSALIDEKAGAVIQHAAELVKQGDQPVVVTGYADTTGSTEANDLLSATRAQVVIDQLIADGVAKDRLQRVAKGATTYADVSLESRRVTISIP